MNFEKRCWCSSGIQDSRTDPIDATGADLLKQAADTTPVEERREQVPTQLTQQRQYQQEGQHTPEGDHESSGNSP
ncbi:hypothetical protein [Luteolibacter sp. Populi]|uniref:hypothetical protein n=1 Tax=Luteolibacter sp. Populi TaxID=3230487 RepID=UPI0034670987